MTKMPLDLPTRMVRRGVATLDPRLDGTMSARRSRGAVGECEATAGHGGAMEAAMVVARQNGWRVRIEGCDCDGGVIDAVGTMSNAVGELTIW
jgi:hypothetical protein